MLDNSSNVPFAPIAGRCEILPTPAGRHLVHLDGRQIADCKTPEAAQRVIDSIIAHSFEARSARSATIRKSEEAETDRLIAALDWSRVRKTVSREPGYSVNALGSRCEAVLDFHGAPVRTCIVLMAAGVDMAGTLPLTSEDKCELAISIEIDEETRAIVSRHV